MRHLIVNGDDFGLSGGINRGILEAHRHGVLTSASLMVDAPAAAQAARLAEDCPDLAVGLHVNIRNEHGALRVKPFAEPAWRSELSRQLDRFRSLTGRLPTHIDAHHHAQRDPQLLPVFLEMADRCRVPLREHSHVRYLGAFYGRPDAPSLIGIEALVRLLETELGQGVTELGCHPGYVEEGLRSSYREEREVELRTLCDPRIRACLIECGITLTSHAEAARLLPWVEQGGAAPWPP